MAWRIHEHVHRGELDNRTRGRVTGRLWLAGVDAPLVLDLRGDCHPDLAGCLLRFENPAPVPMTTSPPALRQSGSAGDITAARKVRVLELPIEIAYPMLKRGEKVPEHLANSLYLEWFSELSGRVVIESADYRLEISEPAWRFTAEELAERERQRTEGSDAFAIEVHSDGTVEEWDEFRHEQLLRESEMTGEKYRRLLEKYAEHPDAERLIAHEMGWERADEELAEEEADEIAQMNEICEAALDEPEPEPNLAREGLDWVRRADGEITHPLAARARVLLDALEADLADEATPLSSTDERCAEAIAQSMTLYVKLSAHLGFIARGRDHTDPGQLIAWLKRDLAIHGQLLTALEALADHPRLPAARQAAHRAELFALREALLTVIGELRDLSA